MLGTTGSALGADVGANDDTGKFALDGGAAFYRQMAGLGLKQTVITVRWIPSDPLDIPHESLLDVTVPAAQAAGLKVVLAVYPYPPREIESGLATPGGFGTWLDRLARRYPTVRQFVVGNEPNQPAFFRPQFSKQGRALSAARFGPFLAAGYDTLKAIDPSITVVGIGLSPRGNDRPRARSNRSTSPIRFLAALGAWYRSTARERPLMDGLSFHPYPNRSTDPLSRGYPWPNAGFVNLDRVKQALWDAFEGTAQPTTLDGFRLYLDEVGWQVDTIGLPGYVGDENVPVTTDDEQAAVYADLVERAACDRDIAEVNVFGFYDDPARPGFQAALFRADGSARPSATAIQAAASDGACSVSSSAWTPRTWVLEARKPKVVARRDGLDVTLSSGEGARVVACVLPGDPSLPDVRAALGTATARTPGCAGGTSLPRRPIHVSLPAVTGRAVVAALYAAEANRRRTTLAQRPFG